MGRSITIRIADLATFAVLNAYILGVPHAHYIVVQHYMPMYRTVMSRIGSHGRFIRVRARRRRLRTVVASHARCTP